MKKRKILSTVLVIVLLLNTLSGMFVGTAAASQTFTNTAPEFDSETDTDLLPFMSEKTFGEQYDDIDGQRLEVSKDENGYDVKMNSQNVNYGVSLVGDDSENQLVDWNETMYYSFTLDANNDLYDSDASRDYGGPMVDIAYGYLNGNYGYFTVRFSARDGVAIEMVDDLGNLTAYLGGNTYAFKKPYPDTGTYNRSNIEYKVVIKLTVDSISMWMNDKLVLDDVSFYGHFSHGGEYIVCAMERFALRVHSYGTRTTVHDIRLWTDGPAPEFDSSTDVDLLPYMSEKTFGAQYDDIDGQRLNVTKDENGYDVKLNSQNVNYGVSLAGDDSKQQFVKEDGTMYYSFTLDAENDLYDSDVSRVYGGPVVDIAYGKLFNSTGYLCIRFTAEDGISFEMVDKLGNLIAYLGGNTFEFKKPYPETGTFYRLDIEYKVVIKLTLDSISMWVNDIVVLDDVPFAGHWSHGGTYIDCEMERFALRVHSYGTRTTVHDIKLWADKSDINGPLVESVELEGTPKTTFNFGDEFVQDNLKLKVNYADSFELLDITPEMISGFDSSVAGNQTVTFAYMGKTTTLNVSVIGEAEISSKKAKAGQTVDLIVSLNSKVECTSLAISNIAYDDSKMELIAGEWLADGLVLENWDQNENCGASAFEGPTDLSGDLIKLTFKINDNIECTSYNIDCDFTVKLDDSNIPFTVKSGEVIIIDVLPGDLNEDDQINDADAVYLLMHTFFSEDYPTNQACDFNGNSKVTDADAVYLLMHTFFPKEYPIN